MAVSPTILVTGGTGFIGRHLVHQLLEAKTGVRLLCRSPDKAHALFGNSVEVVKGDVTSAETARAACQDISLVYHVAGLYRFGMRHHSALWNTNVEGTRNLLTAARQAGVKRFVHCSTAGILAAKGRLITHLDFPRNPPRWCGYKISKWHAEQAALRAASEGQDVVIASPTAPIGSGDDRPTPTGQMILDLMHNRFPACSKTGLNIVAVQDVARGLIALGNRGQPGRRYLLGHENLWLEDFLTQVAAQIGCAAPKAWVPWPLVAAGGLVGDAIGLLTGHGGERLCWETAYYARQEQFFDLSPTRHDTGWQAEKTLESAIAESVAWFASRSKSETPLPKQAANRMEKNPS